MTDQELIKNLKSTIQCALALDMRYDAAVAVLTENGFCHEDRFDLPATEFVNKKLKESLKLIKANE